jgi:hypothetical protein
VFAVLSSALLASSAVALPASPAGAALVLAPGASTSHPYSNPVWWPFDVEMKMDCYVSNPGCTAPHPDWLVDFVSTNRTVSGPTAHEPVYAMGAGIVHWGVTSDQGCGGVHGRGNWLWIDHGNGVSSMYGHLAWPFPWVNGAYVTARTKIGEIGHSGYSACNTYPTLHYTDVTVKRGSTTAAFNGTYAEIPYLYACASSTTQQKWPAQLPGNPGSWTVWNAVPAKTAVPAVATRTCITATPRTPNRATSVALKAPGSATLVASWVRPTTGPAPTSIVVLLRRYNASARTWVDDTKRTLSATATSTKFTSRLVGRVYRVYVYMRNGVGLGASAASTSVTAR